MGPQAVRHRRAPESVLMSIASPINSPSLDRFRALVKAALTLAVAGRWNVNIGPAVAAAGRTFDFQVPFLPDGACRWRDHGIYFGKLNFLLRHICDYSEPVAANGPIDAEEEAYALIHIHAPDRAEDLTGHEVIAAHALLTEALAAWHLDPSAIEQVLKPSSP